MVDSGCRTQTALTVKLLVPHKKHTSAQEMRSGSKLFMIQANQEHSVLAFLNLNFSNIKKVKSNPCCSVRSFFSPSAVVIELNSF